MKKYSPEDYAARQVPLRREIASRLVSDPAGALPWLRRAYELAIEQEEREDVCGILGIMARAARSADQYGRALRYSIAAVRACPESAGAWGGLALFEETTAERLARRGDLARALRHAERSIAHRRIEARLETQTDNAERAELTRSCLAHMERFADGLRRALARKLTH